ncbi:hypothetical protein [Labrenzia sp. 011]|uniref:hypothetical protein n=1 Tax=Labrenzia sp. 011 TaxID=2171494 RepID=UPI0010572B34|nr:hypothetical protein [Labrenzia sp. 011]
MNNSGSSAGEAVKIGSNSPQIMQALYSELTGKTEKISKSYSKPKIVNIDDILSISDKWNQFCEQYHTTGSNITIEAKFSNGETQKFSSSDRFRIFDKSLPYTTESISIELKGRLSLSLRW